MSDDAYESEISSGTILPAAVQWSVWDHRRVNLFSTFSKDERDHLDLETVNRSGEPSGQIDLSLPSGAIWAPIALICFAGDGRDDVTTGDLEQAGHLARQLAVALANAGLLRELKELNMGTLNALARTVDAKSSWTAGHSERVTQLSFQLGKTMGLSMEQLNDMRTAAYLHDIGKIGIPLSILDKPGPLTDDEFDRIRRHPSIGARILDPISAYRRLIPIVEQHHERYDDRGYPHGLAGEAIHPLARIMAVADAYDAMVSDRPYRKGMPLAKVRSIIHEESGRQFDPEVVNAFELVLTGKVPPAMMGVKVKTTKEHHRLKVQITAVGDQQVESTFAFIYQPDKGGGLLHFENQPHVVWRRSPYVSPFY